MYAKIGMVTCHIILIALCILEYSFLSVDGHSLGNGVTFKWELIDDEIKMDFVIPDSMRWITFGIEGIPILESNSEDMGLISIRNTRNGVYPILKTIYLDPSGDIKLRKIGIYEWENKLKLEDSYEFAVVRELGELPVDVFVKFIWAYGNETSFADMEQTFTSLFQSASITLNQPGIFISNLPPLYTPDYSSTINNLESTASIENKAADGYGNGKETVAGGLVNSEKAVETSGIDQSGKDIEGQPSNTGKDTEDLKTDNVDTKDTEDQKSGVGSYQSPDDVTGGTPETEESTGDTSSPVDVTGSDQNPEDVTTEESKTQVDTGDTSDKKSVVSNVHSLGKVDTTEMKVESGDADDNTSDGKDSENVGNTIHDKEESDQGSNHELSTDEKSINYGSVVTSRKEETNNDADENTSESKYKESTEVSYSNLAKSTSAGNRNVMTANNVMDTNHQDLADNSSANKDSQEVTSSNPINRKEETIPEKNGNNEGGQKDFSERKVDSVHILNPKTSTDKDETSRAKEEKGKGIEHNTSVEGEQGVDKDESDGTKQHSEENERKDNMKKQSLNNLPKKGSEEGKAAMENENHEQNYFIRTSTVKPVDIAESMDQVKHVVNLESKSSQVNIPNQVNGVDDVFTKRMKKKKVVQPADKSMATNVPEAGHIPKQENNASLPSSKKDCNCPKVKLQWYDVFKDNENTVYFAVIGISAFFTGMIVLCLACCCAKSSRTVRRTRKDKAAFYQVDDYQSSGEEEVEFLREHDDMKINIRDGT